MSVVITLWILGMIGITLVSSMKDSDASVSQFLFMLLGVIVIGTLSIVTI